MENKQLLEKLARLGYPLLETQVSFDVNKALADVVKSKNVRFFEGFPVMLANAAQDKNFNYQKVEALLRNRKDKDLLKDLFLLSLALLKDTAYHLPWPLTDREKRKMGAFRGSLRLGTYARVGNYELNSERLKQVFSNYYVHKTRELKELGNKYEEMSLEFAMSQMFSPKQKDLFLKKLKGEMLTKTEREYFSRTVKKKTAALANSELHHLAQKVFQN
jgi:hypothetical protein